MRLIDCLVASGLAALALGAVAPSHILHEKRDTRSVSAQWNKRSRMPADAMVPVRIALMQRNLEHGMSHLMRISDPTSPDYGKHWTKEEVVDMFAPSAETIESVKSWLVEMGIERKRIACSDNKAFVAFDGTTEEAERLFMTEYHVYEHTGLGKRAVGTEEYHVPRHLSQHIEYISPGVKLAVEKTKKRSDDRTKAAQAKRALNKLSPSHRKRQANETSCSGAITPGCIAGLYQIPASSSDYSSPSDSNKLGIFEAANYYQQKDLDLYFAKYAPNIPQGTGPEVIYIDTPEDDGSIVGDTKDPTSLVLESELDLTLAYPIIWPQQITLYQVDDVYEANKYYYWNDFLDAVDGSYCTYAYMNQTGNDPSLDGHHPEDFDNLQPGVDEYTGPLQCGTATLTNVLSVSYGGDEQMYPLVYMQRACNEYMKLGLQGHTIVYASGDSGVAGNEGGCLGPNHDIFIADFPANCPAVLSVGATTLSSSPSFYHREVVARLVDSSNDFTPGGGFSNAFPAPAYQVTAVNSYLTNHDPGYKYYNVTDYTSYDEMYNGGGQYNRGGRGYPDVAAIGQNIANYNAGEFNTDYGTSASAPIVAAMINRINEVRLASGKRPVGFVNPVFYQNPHMFNDIIEGTNDHAGCPGNGFAAVTGWDPVTGLGTPNYVAMKQVLTALP